MSLSLRSVPIATAAGLAIITLAAWAALLAGLPMTDPATFLVAWIVMMAAMMLPSSAPLFLLYRLSAGDGSRSELRTLALVAGYLLVWAFVGVIVLIAQRILDAAFDPGSRPLGVAAVFVAAGTYQFTPLKATCLRACQTPADFLVRHWRGGALGALRLGVDHGLYCLGCCWALMAVLFVVGLMNLVWMAAVAGVFLIEKNWRHGVGLTRVVGGAVMGLGIAVLVDPALLSWLAPVQQAGSMALNG